MCDYSLHHVASRPARVSDKLITTKLLKTNTRAFAAVGEHGAQLVIHDDAPEVTVCLLPGTELAFDDNVRYDRAFRRFGKARLDHKVARFRQVDLDNPHVQHDALEFPDGRILKIARLTAGQTATVLQLPVATSHVDRVEVGDVARSADSRIALNRLPARPGMAMLVPNQSAVLLWQSLRSATVELSVALVESLRRLAAHKKHSSREVLPAGADIETNETQFNNDLLTPLLEKSAAPKSEKKVDVKAAA